MLYYRAALSLSLLVVLLLSGCSSTQKAPIDTHVVPGGNSQAALDALQLQGHPYVYGGKSPEEGFDCSGLVVYVYNRQGLKLPRTTRSLAQQLPPVRPELRQPGDLLFFHTDKPFSHVGIYVGNDNFVHAPSSRTGHVMVSNLQQPYWRARFIGVRRPVDTRSLSMNGSEYGVCLASN